MAKLLSKPSFQKKLSSPPSPRPHPSRAQQQKTTFAAIASHPPPSSKMCSSSSSMEMMPPKGTMDNAHAGGHSFGGGERKRRPSTTTRMPSTIFAMFLVMMMAMMVLLGVGIPTANGYNIERLYNNGPTEAQQLAMLRQFQNADELWRSTKKSPEFNGAKLTKFAGNGARNCFFTPIQCMLQHDVNKLRRMVDPAEIGQVA